MLKICFSKATLPSIDEHSATTMNTSTKAINYAAARLPIRSAQLRT